MVNFIYMILFLLVLCPFSSNPDIYIIILNVSISRSNFILNVFLDLEVALSFQRAMTNLSPAKKMKTYVATIFSKYILFPLSFDLNCFVFATSLVTWLQ